MEVSYSEGFFLKRKITKTYQNMMFDSNVTPACDILFQNCGH